jgi:inositol hexakisphosphate/diphosphoinositol-pentakisphosphate kinase
MIKDSQTEAELPRQRIPAISSAPAGLNTLTGRRIEDGPIIVGVCAMDNKAHSGPMTEMLNRLTSFTADGHTEFKVVYFGNETLLDEPVESWPLCEALIAFFSTNFPLEKAQQYVALRRPLVFNDLHKQELLFDRRNVYRILEEHGVPVPNYAVMNSGEENAIDEQEEYLEINGKRIEKPLVEKPISGEDHNIYLYYPRSLGGGSKRLFRKVRAPELCARHPVVPPEPI